MEQFFKMDIFFVVATIGVVVVVIALLAIAYRVWKILSHVERVAGMLEQEASGVRDDIRNLRGRLGLIVSSFTRLFAKPRKQSAEKKKIEAQK